MTTTETITSILSQVLYPSFPKPLTQFGFVQSIDMTDAGAVIVLDIHSNAEGGIDNSAVQPTVF